MNFFAMLLSLLAAPVSCNRLDGYYWREYLGTVPKDALSAGKDADGNDVFIGQAYLKSAGLTVGRILPSANHMHVTFGTFVTVGKYMKVLCGNPENFYWMPTNASSFKWQVADKYPVIGGHDDFLNDHLNIGRAQTENDLTVGKVDASNRVGNGYFYYSDDVMERRLAGYEVLMYGKNEGKGRK